MADTTPASKVLPDVLRNALGAEADALVGWATSDLGDVNQYRVAYVALTEADVIVLDPPDAPVRRMPMAGLAEATVVEGQGVDRLVLLPREGAAVELRYSRSRRRDMTRLHRKIERRLARRDGKEAPPEWLERVERDAELQELCPRCKQPIPSYADGVCPACLQKRSILWRLMEVAQPYRLRIYTALLLTLGVAVLGAAMPAISKYFIDAIAQPAVSPTTGQTIGIDLDVSQRLNKLLFWSGVMLATIIVAELVSAARLWILARVGTQVTADLRHLVYAHMQKLSLRYFAKRRTGSLITRVTNDTDRLWDFIVFGSVNLIRDVGMIVCIAIVMLYMNWVLALVAIAPLPVLAILTYVRGMRMQAQFGKLWTYWSRMSAVVGDAVPGIRVVKAFANEKRELDRFDRRSVEYTAKEQEIHNIWTPLQAMVSGLMRLGSLLIWVVGGYLVLKYPSEKNSIGTLIAFNGFVWQFYGPVMELANSNRMVTRAATSAQRIYEVLDTAPEIYSTRSSIKPDRVEGRVEFKQVSFSYEGAAPALREISLIVEPGEMIGLCGPSGAGKSTFVNLISRFYDVTDGQILVDGRDIRDYDVQWLRRQIGVVLQEPYLFHGTIAENIRYGYPDATAEQVIAAARAANAHDFIVAFPDGYDTMVGERGQSLSGGERQRVSIARAILHNPRILILDEATSSVDTDTEKQIQQALDRLVTGRTTFAIAHRLSTLQAATRLVVLEKGKIVEQGKHADLLALEGGVYSKLVRTQVEMNSLVAVR